MLEMALAHSWQRLIDEVRAHESEIGEEVAERLIEDATALRAAEGPGPSEPGEPIMGPPGPAGPAGSDGAPGAPGPAGSPARRRAGPGRSRGPGRATRPDAQRPHHAASSPTTVARSPARSPRSRPAPNFTGTARVAGTKLAKKVSGQGKAKLRLRSAKRLKKAPKVVLSLKSGTRTRAVSARAR